MSIFTFLLLGDKLLNKLAQWRMTQLPVYKFIVI